MEYNGTIYRPPLEAETFLLPITEGCTHNSCIFCNMYRGIPFRILPLADVEEYLSEMKHRYGPYCAGIRRVYLVGADPFALTAKQILERIALIRRYLPNAATITMYARTDNISHKSDEDLRQLGAAGVNDLYVGVECALDDVLKRMNKGYGVEETRRQSLRLNAAGIRHCDLLMLGMAGKGRGIECARATADLLNGTRPHKILVNTMSAFKGTQLDDDIRAGAFIPAAEKEDLEEERELISCLDLPDCWFWAKHPLDTIKLEGLLGLHKHRMLNTLERSMGHVSENAINRISRSGTL